MECANVRDPGALESILQTSESTVNRMRQDQLVTSVASVLVPSPSNDAVLNPTVSGMARLREQELI